MINKNRILKVIAGLLALLIVSGLLFIVNSFVGNPISASIATSKINSYVQANYSDLELEVSKATYNFKTSAYQSFAVSKKSEDTRFSISWRKGHISDYYESEVVSRFSTYRRLSEEFDDVIERIISEEFPYEVDLVIGDFTKSEGDFSTLVLDMPLDIHNPPLKTTLTIWTFIEEYSYEALAEQLLDLHRLMLKHQIPINEYSLRLMKDYRNSDKKEFTPDEFYVYDFPAELISEQGLIERIKEHQKDYETRYSK